MNPSRRRNALVVPHNGSYFGKDEELVSDSFKQLEREIKSLKSIIRKL